MRKRISNQKYERMLQRVGGVSTQRVAVTAEFIVRFGIDVFNVGMYPSGLALNNRHEILLTAVYHGNPYVRYVYWLDPKTNQAWRFDYNKAHIGRCRFELRMSRPWNLILYLMLNTEERTPTSWRTSLANRTVDETHLSNTCPAMTRNHIKTTLESPSRAVWDRCGSKEFAANLWDLALAEFNRHWRFKGRSHESESKPTPEKKKIPTEDQLAATTIKMLNLRLAHFGMVVEADFLGDTPQEDFKNSLKLEERIEKSMQDMDTFLDELRKWGEVGKPYSIQSKGATVAIAKVKMMSESQQVENLPDVPEFYPNHYVTLDDLVYLKSRLPVVHVVPLDRLNKEGLVSYHRFVEAHADQVMKYCMCIDSMREGMTYQTLAELYNVSIPRVINVLKMTRPEPR